MAKRTRQEEFVAARTPARPSSAAAAELEEINARTATPLQTYFAGINADIARERNLEMAAMYRQRVQVLPVLVIAGLATITLSVIAICAAVALVALHPPFDLQLFQKLALALLGLFGLVSGGTVYLCKRKLDGGRRAKRQLGHRNTLRAEGDKSES